MNAFRVTMTATALMLALAAARADPYVGTDDDGNLQLRSAAGQSVFANSVDLVRSHPVFFTSCSKARPGYPLQRRRRKEWRAAGSGGWPLSPPPAHRPSPKAVQWEL